jgi:hypothetical protein
MGAGTDEPSKPSAASPDETGRDFAYGGRDEEPLRPGPKLVEHPLLNEP